ncbi:MAG TPA: alpha/beta hydrolase [Jatrophihabitans sp.]|nr:alpha/beta hydrolase [Jatrophihabitans sp.]
MSDRVEGALYYEALGPRSAPPVLFIHPNPMDNSCWLFQMAHFSTWFRCVAVDLPGYGRSPASRPGLTVTDIADACWAALEIESAAPSVLVGCSVGSYVAQHMYHRRPDRVSALVLCGAGWRARKSFPARRIAEYREHGVGHRYNYTLQDFAEPFRSSPLAHWFAELFTERNDHAHLESIIRNFEALEPPDPEWLQTSLHAPVLILSGEHDPTGEGAPALQQRLPDAELITIPGAGHACHMEQPWRFDREMASFLERRGLLPEGSVSRGPESR